jgi:hypothetical protein
MIKQPLLTAAWIVLLVAAGNRGGTDERTLAPGEAASLQRKPAAFDAEAKRVMTRAEVAYQRLKSLGTVSRDGGVVVVALLQRPRFYQLTQKLESGELIASAVSDGKRYFEYQQRKQQYLERGSDILGQLALPVNVRLFFPEQRSSNLLSGLDGKPTVREYGYRYRGKAAVAGKPAERVDVSVMVRSADGAWHTFVSERYFDLKSGLLVRAVNGSRTMEIQNTPNVKISPGQFRWSPPAGSVKGLG